MIRQTNSPRPETRWHGFVEGIVQGVGFRYFVRDEAVRLELRGWVRNRSDGRVEVTAEGSQGALEALLESLKRGPRASRVESVSGETLSASGEFSNFRLERTL